MVGVLFTMMCQKSAPKIGTYLGFGIGPKSCPGQEMARIQTVLLISHLITKCRYNNTSYSLLALSLHVIFFTFKWLIIWTLQIRLLSWCFRREVALLGHPLIPYHNSFGISKICLIILAIVSKSQVIYLRSWYFLVSHALVCQAISSQCYSVFMDDLESLKFVITFFWVVVKFKFAI